MSLKYSPTYALDVPSALLLPLALELLHRLHNSGCSVSDDQIETFFLKGVFDENRPQGFGGSLLVLDILDGDEEPDDVCERSTENCIRCDARVYDNPKDELCVNCRKDDKKEEDTDKSG